MSSRFGEPSDPFEDEGQASAEPGLPGKRITGDPQDDMPVAGDTPLAVDDYGTTAREEFLGEPLDGRLAREEPDLLETAPPVVSDREGIDNPYPADREEQVGRIVETDEGAREDTEPDAVAIDVGVDEGGFTAEERAMHIEPEV
ncbi:MAG: hypothetical protein JO079_07280 [Frankiaceae bacterium]|nr:hypothetical protein [Frankiaceae bacterium]